MSYLLAIETSGTYGSVALLPRESTSGDCRQIDLPRQSGSAKSLAPAIAALLDQCGVASDRVGCIGLLSGPGSFTGLRVGIATAKALSYAWKIPIVGIDTMDAIHEQTQTAAEFCDPTNIRHAILDAYREQLFVQSRGPGMNPRTTVQNLHDFLLDCQKNPRRQIMVGPGCARVSRFLSEAEEFRNQGAARILNPVFLESIPRWGGSEFEPNATSVAMLARREWLLGNVADPFSIVPQYFRGSAAEEKISRA